MITTDYMELARGLQNSNIKEVKELAEGYLQLAENFDTIRRKYILLIDPDFLVKELLMILKRNSFRPDGVFGELTQDDGTHVAVTLEHAYIQPDGSYLPKIPLTGTFTCQRGQHQLEGMTHPFTTFEIMNIPNHTNILFHMGNYNESSDGCCLLGEAIMPQTDGTEMITHSVDTFVAFMNGLQGITEFTLTVS